MAPWLQWRRWLGGIDYEHELPRLADQITAAHAALAVATARQRRWPALFLMQTALVYVAYALFVLLSSARKRRFRHQVGLVLTPVLLGLFFRLLRLVAAAAVSRRERRLKALTDRRKALVNEYKKKTNFDKIRELIADPEAPEPPKTTSKKKGQASPQGKRGRTGKLPQGNNATAPGPGGVPANVPAGQTTGAARPNGSRPARGAADANLAVGGAADGLMASGDSSNVPANAPGALTAAPYRRTWIDRLVDLVLGENEMSPANRDALICPKCFSHNGLAPFGKSASEVTYRCPVCGYLNLSKETKAEMAAQEAASHSDSKDPAVTPREFSEAKNKEEEKDVSEDVSEDENGAHKPKIARTDVVNAEPSASEDAKSTTPRDSASSSRKSSPRADVSPKPEAPSLGVKTELPKVEALKSQDSGRQGSPASTESAKSLSQHLESPADEADPQMTVEERIMREINGIRREIAESQASAAKHGAASSSASASSRSSPAA